MPSELIPAVGLRRAYRTSQKCFGLATGRYDSALGGAIDETLAARMRGEQVRSVLRHLTSNAVATLFNTAILVVALWGTASAWLLCSWAALMACAVGLVLAPRIGATARSRPSRASPKVIAQINTNAFLSGVLWGVMPVLFFAEASQGGRLVIACIAAGMIGGGAFALAAIPTAAIAMILPIAIGSLWTLAQAGGEFTFVIYLVLCYCGVLIRGVLLHALDFFRQFVTQSEIQQLSKRDSLTNLDNRATFRGMVAEAMLRLERSSEPCAILYIDIDNLKKINEQHGHAAGDQLLIDAANRLRGFLRGVDRMARLGSDRFAILAPNLAGETTLRAYATRIVQAFAHPQDQEATLLNASVSVGVFAAQQGIISVEKALRNTELALQNAQRKGHGSFHVFGPSDDAAQFERDALERDLLLALERREFTLVFQPMLRLTTQSIEGFEALLRWRHPTRGNVPPDVFIPIAEETGAIDAIGAWVMREACAVAAHWPQSVRVCVNVSAHQLNSHKLHAQVLASLEAANLAPSRLEIEITETVLVADDSLPLEILTGLRAAGVRLALDDFGTGYSSLSYLRRLPFDRIKIDRSFVTGIVSDRDSAAIVKSIIGLAADLGLDVIAEGIETPEQLEALMRLNCPEVQGYLIGKPMPEQRIEAYLRAGARLAAA